MLQRSHHATDSMTEIYEVGSKRLSQSGNMRARRRKRQTVREQESKRETERLGDRELAMMAEDLLKGMHVAYLCRLRCVTFHWIMVNPSEVRHLR